MSTSRREFLQSSAIVGTTAVVADRGLTGNVHAQGPDVIRVGLIGCGDRGTGAAGQCLRAGQNIRLVAMGDAFEDRVASCLQRLMNDNNLRGRIDVPAERRFVGLDAFERVVQNCDLVLLTAPPGFRPAHLQAAVRARKHIFAEKPVAVDGPGARLCLELAEEATRQRLSIVAGTQRRYQTGYLESMRQIHDGALGTITSARCYWNQGPIWVRPREQGWTDLQWHVAIGPTLPGSPAITSANSTSTISTWSIGPSATAIQCGPSDSAAAKCAPNRNTGTFSTISPSILNIPTAFA